MIVVANVNISLVFELSNLCSHAIHSSQNSCAVFLQISIDLDLIMMCFMIFISSSDSSFFQKRDNNVFWSVLVVSSRALIMGNVYFHERKSSRFLPKSQVSFAIIYAVPIFFQINPRISTSVCEPFHSIHPIFNACSRKLYLSAFFIYNSVFIPFFNCQSSMVHSKLFLSSSNNSCDTLLTCMVLKLTRRSCMTT